jgi:hypothetical protein
MFLCFSTRRQQPPSTIINAQQIQVPCQPPAAVRTQ